MRPGGLPSHPVPGYAPLLRHRPTPAAAHRPYRPCAPPRVVGVDDFALRRRHRYATIIIDAETGERVDVLPDRQAAILEAWLRGKKGVEVVCRDGSATYAEAIRRALPDAVQVSDRWHLWQNLCDKVLAEVRTHAPCWATVNPLRPGGVREQTTRERWHQVHALLDSGVGLLDCSRRLNLALNTVKRYARIPEPSADRIGPRYRPTLVDPYRDHLRRRRAQDPGRFRHPPAARDQGTGLHRQFQPAGPLPQPGPCRRRPARDNPPPRRPAPPHPPRAPVDQGHRTARPPHRGPARR
jgi:hypothetical protein